MPRRSSDCDRTQLRLPLFKGGKRDNAVLAPLPEVVYKCVLSEKEIFSPRGQMILLLLGTLHQMQKGGTQGAFTKQHVICHMESDRLFFLIRPQDELAYPFSMLRQPRWHRLVEQARHECANKLPLKLIRNDARDSWQVTGEGINEFVAWKHQFQQGFLDLSRCYLWGDNFKKLIRPDYCPSCNDVERPIIYEDFLPGCQLSPRGDPTSRRQQALFKEWRKEAMNGDHYAQILVDWCLENGIGTKGP